MDEHLEKENLFLKLYFVLLSNSLVAITNNENLNKMNMIILIA